jgi:hypothetical protein
MYEILSSNGNILQPLGPPVEVEVLGTKQMQKPGGPVHFCLVCDLPIAIAGRLVRICFSLHT